jgi:hypothetical protein
MWHGEPMTRGRTLWAVAIAIAFVAACNQPPQKPANAGAQPAAEKTPSQPEPSRIGTVGLVREIKDRGMTIQNLPGIIESIFTNEADKDVIRVRYEVTVFYKDGGQGVVILDQRPALQSGQRVRVTGDRIEPLDR